VNADGTITGIASGLCLDVVGNKTGNGPALDLWTCNGQRTRSGPPPDTLTHRRTDRP
jgi:hypothetical protein